MHLILFGCTPSLPQQRIIQQEAAIEQEVEKALATPLFTDAPWPEGKWWKIFNDPLLDTLIEKAVSLNPTIEIANSKIRKAQADVRLAKAKLMPMLWGFADFLPQLLTRTGLFTPRLAPGFSFAYAQTDLDLNLSYDLDLWDQNKNTLKAQRDQFFAEVYEGRLSQLLLSLAVAETYFSLKTALQTESLAAEVVRNRQAKQQLVELRVRHALDNQIALLAVEQDYFTALKFLHEAEKARAIEEHALYTLVAEGSPLPPIGPNLDVESFFPFPLPECLALNLIARRPDIQSQLWRIDAAGKMIKVREADYYPNINLTALIGLSTIFPEKLFNLPSSTYQYGPALNLPVFKGGAIEAGIDLAKEEFLICVEHYNGLVLQAIQEMKDALTSIEKLNQEWLVSEKNVSLANASLALMEMRMGSLSNRIDFLDQEEIYFVTQSEKIGVETKLLSALLQLVRALGG